MTAQRKDPIDYNFRNYLQTRYSTIPKNDLEKKLDSLLELAKLARDKNRNLRSVLEKAASTIFRLFDFSEIAIGLRNPKDGLYRYEILYGYTKNTEAAFKKLSYTDDDMVSYDKYPFVKTGRISELDPAEGTVVAPDRDSLLYDRPLAVDAARQSPEDFLEGDYIDVWMYDSSDKLIGWIELSRPKKGKMPSPEAVRWVEVIAELCALIVDRGSKDGSWV